MFKVKTNRNEEANWKIIFINSSLTLALARQPCVRASDQFSESAVSVRFELQIFPCARLGYLLLLSIMQRSGLLGARRRSF